MPAVQISYELDLGPSIPAAFRDIARHQGEDPNLTCAYLQELKDMIYGMFHSF